MNYELTRKEARIYFCENCGAKLPHNALFCENCGTKTSQDESNTEKFASLPSKDVFIFNNLNWKQHWSANKKNAFHAIILTNTSECTEQQRETFYKSLKKYADFRRKYGNTDYFVLDMRTQKVVPAILNKPSSIDFILKVLKFIYNVCLPDYLFIIGDRDAIGSISWVNPLHHSPHLNRDSDKTVDSDLPYATLSDIPPFQSIRYRHLIRVGRVPASAKSGFEEAIKYFDNTTAATLLDGFGEKSESLVLCAEEWQKCSRNIFHPNSKELYPCGPYSFVSKPGLKTLSNFTTHNLYCFNLHGSPVTDYWVNGNGCPAYSPKTLPSRKGYVIGTEACYGAKPVIRSSNEQSILITALKNGCLGFLGSTQIAFGAIDEYFNPKREFSNADAMVGKFTKYVSNGYSLGESYVKALKDMIKNSTANKLRGEECKTLASFALYGDPSMKCFNIKSKINERKIQDNEDKQSFLGNITMPDIIATVDSEIAKVNQEISETIEALVLKISPFFSDTKPTYFRLNNASEYVASYSKTQNDLTKIMNIYFDDSGTVTDVFVSK